MKVRSLPLLLTAIALLASAAALGAVLRHDGVVGADVGDAGVGESVRLRADPEPWQIAQVRIPAWAEVMQHLANETYVTDVDGLTVLITADGPLPDGTLVIEGGVLWRGPHPVREGEVLLLHADEVGTPLLFR